MSQQMKEISVQLSKEENIFEELRVRNIFNIKQSQIYLKEIEKYLERNDLSQLKNFKEESVKFSEDDELSSNLIEVQSSAQDSSHKFDDVPLNVMRTEMRTSLDQKSKKASCRNQILLRGLGDRRSSERRKRACTRLKREQIRKLPTEKSSLSQLKINRVILEFKEKESEQKSNNYDNDKRQSTIFSDKIIRFENLRKVKTESEQPIIRSKQAILFQNFLPLLRKRNRKQEKFEVYKLKKRNFVEPLKVELNF